MVTIIKMSEGNKWKTEKVNIGCAIVEESTCVNRRSWFKRILPTGDSLTSQGSLSLTEMNEENSISCEFLDFVGISQTHNQSIKISIYQISDIIYCKATQ